MGGGRIDRLSRRERLDHVVKHPAVLFVVQELGAEEIVIDALRTAVIAADQLLVLPPGLLLLLDVPHDRAHAAAALPPGVVGETDDGYLPRLPCSWMLRRAALMSASSCAVRSRSTALMRPMLARMVRRFRLLPIAL